MAPTFCFCNGLLQIQLLEKEQWQGEGPGSATETVIQSTKYTQSDSQVKLTILPIYP